MSQPITPPPFAAIVPAFDPEQALQPIAGASLVERQLRLLAAAGVTHAVLLVEGLPADMAAVVGGVRGGRMRIDIVRSLAEAVPQLHGATRVLVLAEGCLPEPDLVGQIALAPMPAVATIADGPGLERYERIDAETRWAGLALLDAGRIGDTAAMLGEWDPASTLLRRAVQEGARRVPAGIPPLLASDQAAMAHVERRLLIGARRGRRGWARRWIEGPLSDRLLPLMLERRVPRAPVGIGAAVLAIAAGILALGGWRWGALAALLVSGAAMASANQLYALHGDHSRARVLQRYGRLAGLALALLGLAIGLFRQDGQWGWLLVALATAAALGTQHLMALLAKHMGGTIDLPWLAAPGALPWAILPFAIAGWWGTGAIALALYAVASAVAAGQALGRLVP